MPGFFASIDLLPEWHSKFAKWLLSLDGVLYTPNEVRGNLCRHWIFSDLELSKLPKNFTLNILYYIKSRSIVLFNRSIFFLQRLLKNVY